LLLIVLVPILKALTRAQVTGTIIERQTRSLMLAQSKLDDIKARSIYNFLSSFTENNTPLDGAYLCNVSDVSVNLFLKEITISVGYDQNGNSILGADETEVTLSTLVAKIE
jgi:hypothetical protein